MCEHSHQAAAIAFAVRSFGASPWRASLRTSVMRASTKADKAISTSRKPISKNIPVETKLMAIATSHAEATYAPMRVHLVRIARPTIISMTPTMCMKVCPLNGNILRASGLMYPVQLAKRLKYLSRPASNGPTPSPIRSTHQPWSNRESNPLFMFACLQENRVGRSESVTGRRIHFSFLSRGGLICNLYCCRDSILWRVCMVNPAEVATSQEPLSDEEVVTRVLAGETGMFEIVMRRHNQRLYRVARAILRNDGEAEDVMQDAYVRAYEHLDQFAGRAKFSTWLTRIAVHEALARQRRRNRYQQLEPTSEREGDPMGRFASLALNPEQQIGRASCRSLLEEAVEKLPDPYRTIFMLRDIEEMSTTDAADVLEITEDNVKVRDRKSTRLN